MPETNIVVSLLGGLLDRAKSLMGENRKSLNKKQQDAKTLEKATRQREEEGKGDVKQGGSCGRRRLAAMAS
jgi:hypothetical protein